MNSKKLIQRITLGTALVAASVGITAPIAYNAGKDSARPVSVEVTKPDNSEYKFLENIMFTDASGNTTPLHQYLSKEVSPIFSRYPDRGNFHKTTYETQKVNDSRQDAKNKF